MKRLVLFASAVLLCACGGSTDPVATVATLTVTPSSPELDTLFSLTQTVQLGVVARDAEGDVIANAPISYSSSNNVVTVSNTGLITSAANGKATVTISSGSVSAQRTVPVRQKYVSLAINPSSFSMVIATTRQVAAEARDALGRPITALTGATFGTLHPGIISIGTTTGLVQALALGNGSVTATLTSPDGTHQATANVEVSDAFPLAASVTLLSSSFNPNEVDIGVGGVVTWTNSSGVVHNITFEAGGPSSINDHSDGTNQRTFGASGSFAYRCTNHAGMNGTVIVH